MIESRARSDDVEIEQMYAQVRRGLFGKADAVVTVGRYEILERIGMGAMGFVYAGRDPQLDRKVAIKLLRPEAGSGSKGRARLLREAQAMAQVSSPFAVTVYEAGTHGQQVFVAMEFVDGQTLTRWLADDARTWREICELFVRAGRGLAAVHDAGLVHRDFKPDNVLIGDDGRPRVADFGLAAAAGERASPESSMIVASMDVRLTRTGVAAGSLAYMSPEQHRREAVDARSDQFGFCVALFEALHGARPFPGLTEEELRPQVIAGEIVWPKPGPRLPKRIVRLLERGLHPEPSRRFASMDALVRELERSLHRTRAWGLALAAAGGGALWAVFGGAWWAPDHDPCVRRGEAAAAAWNDERRDAVVTALRGTGEAYAGETAQKVAGQLDDYAHGWNEVLGETCAAPEPEVIALACLDRSLGEMRALADALIDEPAQLVGHASAAAYKLRDPTVCRDEPSAALRGVASTDPQTAAARGRVWSAIDDAAVRLNAGDYAVGLSRARRAVDKARATNDGVLLAEALFLRGTLTSHAGDHAQAEADLFEAATVAERAGHWEVLARARTELVVVVGYRQGRAEEAAVWSSLAQAALERHHRRDLIEVRLLNARGLVARGQDDPSQARTHLEAALALAREVLPADHPGLASTLENLAHLEADEGNAPAARVLLEEALSIRHRSLGDDHPDTKRNAAALDAL